MSELIDLTKERLKKEPVIYTIKIIHNEKGMSYEVYDIQESPKDYELVADNLEKIVNSLRVEADEWREGLKHTNPSDNDN